MGFLSALISFAISQAAAHPDILQTLGAGIAGAIDAHDRHPDPGSAPALAELRAGMAAAASSAVTSLMARHAPSTSKPVLLP